MLKTYSIRIRHSKDGKSWAITSIFVRAESDISALAQARSRYKYISDIRILSVR
ncbi:hypothetical protein [Fusobacterium sp.]|mgnify:CR=1 FL=1|uniref:hypothetical protein n=1 Tax=Fusobacterium sp. TaxID=68766 RepID=UPI0015D00195|nr:hypothetical protein [Fusobacterium sp.]